MQTNDTGVMTPASESTEVDPGQPAMPARRRGQRINASWPDWTQQQSSILLEAARRYRSVHGKNIEWKRALTENPTWHGILLAGGRPFYHLWHTSAELLAGRKPTRPGAAKKLGLRTPRAHYTKNRVKTPEQRRTEWREKKREWRAVNTPGSVPIVRPQPTPQQPVAVPMARIEHCPHCGGNLTPFHKAKEQASMATQKVST